MKQKIFKDKYHIFEIEYKKEELRFNSIDEIIDALQTKMDAHPVIKLLTIFDHYAHTSSLVMGKISPQIKAAKNIIFLFWKRAAHPGGFSGTSKEHRRLCIRRFLRYKLP